MKDQCEECSKMDLCNLSHIAKNTRLNENQPLAVFFVNADDSIVIDLYEEVDYDLRIITNIVFMNIN